MWKIGQQENLVTFLTHTSAKSLTPAWPEDKGPKEGTDGCKTPEAKLIFDLPGEHDDAAQKKRVHTNPFEALNGEDNSSNFFRKALKALEKGWIFQGRKKHKVKIEPTCLEADHPPHLVM
jgi:hypothetical protein